MQKTARTRLIIVAAFVAVIGSGSIANAVVFANADAPLTLSQDGVQLAQARGSVSDSSSDKFSYTAGYQRDRKANGDGVFTKIDTDYTAKLYSLAGTYQGIFNYNNVERVRTSATSSAAWTRQTDKTVSVVANSYQDLNSASYVVDVRICEDRGILHADPCKSKSLTLSN